jgi:DNA-binding MarR family transcriptional regulator
MDGHRQWRRAHRERALDALGRVIAELDDVIHQPLRLRIMAALNALPNSVGLEFSKLKKLTGATDGNLGAHIETLAKAGYVRVDKAFVGKKPQTTVTASAAGRGAFARHVATLQEIIAGSEGET